MNIHLIILLVAGYVLSEYVLLHGATPDLELTSKNIGKKTGVFGLSITLLTIYWWSYSWVVMIGTVTISYGYLATARSLFAQKYPDKPLVREVTYLVAIILLITIATRIENVYIEQTTAPIWLREVFSSGNFYPIVVYVSAFIINISGGTVLVRAMLEQTGKLPLTEETKLNKREYNVGRWIGGFERTLILIFVLINNYLAIGLVLTAKSAARFNDLSDREFAEYYILGTLMSTLVAIAVGEAVNYLLKNNIITQLPF